MTITFSLRWGSMKLNNGVLSVEISDHGAEIKSVIKDNYEYMWCGDKKYWGRTSPVLFPIVGGLKDKKYTFDGKEYAMGQHGFARDFDFELLSSDGSSVEYVLKSSDETLKIYPFLFELKIKYVLKNNVVSVWWEVKNTDNKEMYFSIGAHPAFNLKDGKNYFGFDNKLNSYNLINENGLYIGDKSYKFNYDGFLEIKPEMFDNDALIVENNQAHVVELCDDNKNPYVRVKFNAPLFGLWSPGGKNAPFVCIEPWYGRCDAYNSDGDFKKKDYIIKLDEGDLFKASYEIEVL